MKKILSLILAGLMTASCAAFVAADEEVVADAAAEATGDAAVEEVAIDENEYAAVKFLNTLKIYQGQAEGSALTADDVNGMLKRYEMAVFVSRMSTGWVDNRDWENHNTNDSTFTDLKGSGAINYLGALSYANQKGIIEGYSATKFGPEDGITYRDALTMVCRTLGYKSLAYPWGYIQTAVELDLHKNVNAAYTDELTRGQVAVILYNALFTEKKDGGTLAKSIFGKDFAWETIAIVSTDELSFDGTLANITDVDKNVYVGFKVVDANGALTGKTYYVKASEFGFDTAKHEDELNLGSVYLALFDVEDGNLVTLKEDCVIPLEMNAVLNRGITDDKCNAITAQPILTALSAYTYKNATADKNYLSFLGNEISIYWSQEVDYFTVDENVVGIDVETSNILKQNDDGTWSIAWYWHDALQRYYEIKKPDQTVASVADQDVYINWMSKEEFAEWYADAIKVFAGREFKWEMIPAANLANLGKDPYATLRLYDLDDDKLGELATYKSYSLGYFANTTIKCTIDSSAHAKDKMMPAYSIVDMDNYPKAESYVVNHWTEEGHVAHDTDLKNAFLWINVDEEAVPGFVNENGSYNNGYVLYNYNKFSGEIEVVKYFNDDYSNDEDTFVVEGVLQGFSSTGNYLIVNGEKYYWAYDNASTDLTDLAGINKWLKKSADGKAIWQAAGWYLDALQMQYVKVAVLDGKVVDIDAVGAQKDEVIVVLDYAGVTADGYIAVYGYSTKDAELTVFKINSYNGWKKGDYRYNPWNASTDEAFNAGTLYTINSYDADTNSYGVYTYDVNEFAETIDTRYNITFDSSYRIIRDLTNKEDITDLDVRVDDQKSTDKYILVWSETDATTDPDTLVSGVGFFINVAHGKDMDGKENEVTGKILYENDGTFVILVDSFEVMGESLFIDTEEEIVYASEGTLDNEIDRLERAYDFDFDDDDWTCQEVPFTNIAGADFLHILNDDVVFFLYDEADGMGPIGSLYDEAIAKDDYLLGSTAVTYYIRNLLNGKYETVTSTNVDLVDGRIYVAINGIVLTETALQEFAPLYDWMELLDTANDGKFDTRHFLTLMGGLETIYNDKVLDVEDLYGKIILVGAQNSFFEFESADDLLVRLAEDLGAGVDPDTESTQQKKLNVKLAQKLITTDKITIRTVSDDRNGLVIEDFTDNVAGLVKGNFYATVTVYDADNKSAVIYIIEEGSKVADTIEKTLDATDEDGWLDYLYSEDRLTESEMEMEYDGVKGYDITSRLVIDWAGKHNALKVVDDDDGYLDPAMTGADIDSLYIGFKYTTMVDGVETVVTPSKTWMAAYGADDSMGDAALITDKESISYVEINYVDNEAEDWDYINDAENKVVVLKKLQWADLKTAIVANADKKIVGLNLKDLGIELPSEDYKQVNVFVKLPVTAKVPAVESTETTAAKDEEPATYTYIKFALSFDESNDELEVIEVVTSEEGSILDVADGEAAVDGEGVALP